MGDAGHFAPPMSETPIDPTSARALLRQRGYVLYWIARFGITLGVQIQSVALGWMVYDVARRTHSVAVSSFYVGMIGLVTFIPVFFLALPAGETADRHDRKTILKICYGLEACTATFLTCAVLFHFTSLPMLLSVAAVYGAVRAYLGPAGSAMGPMLVPRELLPRSIAWSSLAWQSGAIAGPALGGVILGFSPAIAFGACAFFYLLALVLVSLIREDTQPVVGAGSRLELVKEGLAYVWNNKIVFGAISLDLFAVLLGGATALLPVFARDVLHVGPEGFGLLRAGPAIGAALVAIVLAAYPIRRHAGAFMFWGVAVFGAATIVFGLSKSLPLSVAALAVLGAADMLSVYVRSTLVQIVIPDAMRGRVSSVSQLFIGASNELGEFESGIVARFLGPVGAALFGGVGALMVTGLWAWMFPALRKADRLA
jgi:MFS family permease